MTEKSWRSRIVLGTDKDPITGFAMIDQLAVELNNDEMLEVIEDLDDAVSTWDFTRAIYNWARDILLEGGALPENG